MASEVTMDTVIEAIAEVFKKQFSLVPPAGVAREMAENMIDEMENLGVCVHMVGDDDTKIEPDEQMMGVFTPKDPDKAPHVDAQVTCTDCGQVVPLNALDQVLVVRFEATEMAAHSIVCPAKRNE